MIQPPDEDTQRLLRLLALKRHESPPPGFFDRLPARVIVNIRAESDLPQRTPWQALLAVIRGEPMIAGSYAALGVGALLFGVSVFQVAVDSDAPSFAESGASAPGPMALPAMLLNGTSVDPSAPVPPLPAGVVFRIAPTPQSPFAQRAMHAADTSYATPYAASPAAYVWGSAVSTLPVSYGLPDDARTESQRRFQQAIQATPVAHR